ncbi:hypothetical protein J437_LFUL017357 [Ladona fulva]|uniref:Uncharacterized protein n=1 Tax=Ladona fulva TaxID=123851 RepID=A0A8K0KVP7_LADFU|nr:hypothetical protein J437_LFUL017357 [Ladona fulva]
MVIISSCPYVRSTYEVNQTFIFAMHLLGIGLVGKSRFCGIIDLYRPISQTTYDLIVNSLERDRTWRKQGFNSLQGVSIVIGNFSGIIKYWTYRLSAAIVKRANLGQIKDSEE